MSRTGRFPKKSPRRLPCILLTAMFIPVALAAPPPHPTALTVAQLDQLLSQLRAGNDGKGAREIAGVKLTERASAAWLAKWQVDLKGERTREALMAIADISAFLEPPEAERPSVPPPDSPAQQQMLTQTANYVKQTLSRMPNFLALRTTTSFVEETESTLEAEQSSGLLKKQQGQRLTYKSLGPTGSADSGQPQLFWLGSFAQEVTYRGGVEVADSSAAATGAARPSNQRMSTVGEFGSVLELFLVDLIPNKMIWEHWEQGSRGPLAVFGYSVPAAKSHFAVEIAKGRPEHPAYHGEIAIDAADGSIWRITIQASGSDTGIVDESSILVEFAPTEIGGSNYVCPVRGVAMVRYFDTFEYANTLHAPVPYQTSINDVGFTNFHLFRSESRIVPGAPKP
jgi:hypothetical protein